MSIGQQFPSEWRSHTDPVSGVTVEQLTNHRGHSHHFYFTNPGWYDNDRRLLFSSDRHNATNLYSLELATGTITQLTDLEQLPLPREVEFCVPVSTPATTKLTSGTATISARSICPLCNSARSTQCPKAGMSR